VVSETEDLTAAGDEQALPWVVEGTAEAFTTSEEVSSWRWCVETKDGDDGFPVWRLAREGSTPSNAFSCAGAGGLTGLSRGRAGDGTLFLLAASDFTSGELLLLIRVCDGIDLDGVLLRLSGRFLSGIFSIVTSISLGEAAVIDNSRTTSRSVHIFKQCAVVDNLCIPSCCSPCTRILSSRFLKHDIGDYCCSLLPATLPSVLQWLKNERDQGDEDAGRTQQQLQLYNVACTSLLLWWTCSESIVLSPWSFFRTKATDRSNCTSNTEEYQTGHIEETIGSLLLLLLHQKKMILFQSLKLTLSPDHPLLQ
jgi:hypothetical protein